MGTLEPGWWERRSCSSGKATATALLPIRLFLGQSRGWMGHSARGLWSTPVVSSCPRLRTSRGENAADGPWEFSLRGVRPGSRSLPFLQFVLCAVPTSPPCSSLHWGTSTPPLQIFFTPKLYFLKNILMYFLIFYVLGSTFILLGI